MCVKERGHTSLSGFRERLRTVGEGRVSSRQAQVSLGLLLTAHGRLSPGPRPPGPLQTWLCMRLLQARQVPAQRGPRLGTEGKPGSPSPHRHGPLATPAALSASSPPHVSLVTYRQGPGGQAGARPLATQRVEKTSLGLPSPRDRPSNPS